VRLLVVLQSSAAGSSVAGSSYTVGSSNYYKASGGGGAGLTSSSSYAAGSRSSYGSSYRSYTADSKPTSLTQLPGGPGPGRDGSYYASYADQYGTTAATDTGAAYGVYNEAEYYTGMETETYNAGYDASGCDSADSSYDYSQYSAVYDTGSAVGYGSVTTTSSSYAATKARPLYATNAPTAYTAAAGASASLQKSSSTDRYYTAASKADPYESYDSGVHWSNEGHNYYYSETEAGYGEGFEVTTGAGYDDYGSSYADEGYSAGDDYQASSSYYKSGYSGTGWSATAAGHGGLGLGSSCSSSHAASSLSTSDAGSLISHSTSTYQASYESLRFQNTIAGSAGFQASHGRRQTEPGGEDFHASSYGNVSHSSVTSQFTSTVATKTYTSSRSVSALTVSTAAQRGPRVDGFTSYLTGSGNASAGIQSDDVIPYGQSYYDNNRQTGGQQWSRDKAGTSDTSNQARGGASAGLQTEEVRRYGQSHYDSDRQQRLRDKAGTSLDTSQQATAGASASTHSGRSSADMTRFGQFGYNDSGRTSQHQYVDKAVASDTSRQTKGGLSASVGSLSAGHQSTDMTRYSQSHCNSDKQQWSHLNAGSSDTSHAVGHSNSTSDLSAPRVFDYKHQDCNEEQASRSADRPYYLSNVKSTKQPARTASPSPEYKRPTSLVGSDTHTGRSSYDSQLQSSLRDDQRESRGMTERRSRATDYEGNRRQTISSSSSGPDRYGSSYSQTSSMQNRQYATVLTGGSRSLGGGQKNDVPGKTSAKIPGLMDNLSAFTTSTAKTGSVSYGLY